MVLGAIACSTSAVVGATDVAPQVSDTAKHDAVQSNWMDRTDIKLGTQSKLGKQVSVETLQPLTHYDENSKSVLFVQGGVGKGGQEHKVNYFDGSGGIWYPYDSATGTVETKTKPERHDETKSLGTVGNIGLGYRQLSNHEHAYVGVNAFYDHVFKGGYKRVSGGVEYVAGLNEIHANLYRNLGTDDRKYIGLHGRSIVLGDPTGLYPYGRDDDTSLYDYAIVDYENHWMLSEKVAASGFDLGYSRTFKNARWARVYADYYNWRGRSPVKVGYYKLNKRDTIKGFKVGAEFHITPHLTLDAGYQTASHHLSGPYATLKYTIGTSKFAWHGGKHSESAITTARSKMLDKVHRSDMVVLDIVQEDYDHGVVDVGL